MLKVCIALIYSYLPMRTSSGRGFLSINFLIVFSLFVYFGEVLQLMHVGVQKNKTSNAYAHDLLAMRLNVWISQKNRKCKICWLFLYLVEKPDNSVKRFKNKITIQIHKVLILLLLQTWLLFFLRQTIDCTVEFASEMVNYWCQYKPFLRSSICFK